MKKSSTMQLEEFFLTRLDIGWSPADSSDPEFEALPEPELDYEIARNSDNDHVFRLALNVELTPVEDQGGLRVCAMIVGFFSFPEDTEENDMQYLARVNGATILYGILRGQVAMTTGSFPSGKVNLPPVVMQDALPQIDIEKANADDEAELAEDDNDYKLGTDDD